jgi:hypothetical protein
MEAIIVPCTQEKIWDTQPDAGAVAARDSYPGWFALSTFLATSGTLKSQNVT